MKNIFKILLIEDNSGDAELFREMVNGCEGDCDLRVADRLSSGLRLLEEEGVDAVFLDLGLPDSSGIDTLKRFQDAEPNIPVIVLTGLTDRELAAKAISIGAQDYLIKGKFESEIIYRSILYSVERKRNEVAIRERKEISDALNRLDNMIHSTLNFDSILKGVISMATESIGIEASTIGLLENEDYVIKYVHNMPDELVGRRVAAVEMKGVLHSASVRDAVAFNDAPQDDRLNLEMIGALGIHSMMIAPFLVRGTVVGAMSFYSLSAPFMFSEVHIDFARRLSASISTALENARLYDALKESEQVSRNRLSQLEAIYSTAPVGLCFIDTDLRFVNINERLAEMTGLPAEKHIGRTIREVLPQLADIVEPYFKLSIETARPTENVEFRSVRKKRDRCWLGSFYPVRGAAGNIIGVNAVVQEITARKRMEEEIKHLANHDALTGLPNRRLFIELIALQLAEAQRRRGKMAVFFLDLDRFKNINDTLGHEAGDELLRQVAEGLRSTVRKSDVVARIGGDEFNLIISNIDQAEDMVDIARKIVEYFDKKFVIAGQEFHVTASVGISVFPDDSEEVDALLRYADIAMYHAKAQGRNNYQFYNPEINIRSLERMQMENWLVQSAERGELFIHYQPQISIKTGKITCAEALVRWRHPEMGLMHPAQFIPLAEETGSITAIDVWVLWSVSRQAKAWQDAGVPMCVTVNLSARLFENPGLVRTVARILKETGLRPESLDLEITESMAMSNIEQTAVRLRELAEMGIHISIDDFGTGYSSLNYLKRLPIERLKIDKSFVQDITSDPDNRIIISAVTAMAHNMKLKVIAEGVETEEQLSFLSSTGCDEMQGFLFSKPLPAEQFEELMTSGR